MRFLAFLAGSGRSTRVGTVWLVGRDAGCCALDSNCTLVVCDSFVCADCLEGLTLGLDCFAGFFLAIWGDVCGENGSFFSGFGRELLRGGIVAQSIIIVNLQRINEYYLVFLRKTRYATFMPKIFQHIFLRPT